MTAKKKSEEIKEEFNEPSEDSLLETLEMKRNGLIAEIKSKLLPNSSLRRGDSGTRARHAQEMANYGPVLAEINEIGRKLGKPPIGLGHLRGD